MTPSISGLLLGGRGDACSETQIKSHAWKIVIVCGNRKVCRVEFAAQGGDLDGAPLQVPQ